MEVISGSEDALLFRLAATTWSVPVSAGYGRRIRFLVEDASNGKLIGIFALGDPVAGLRARDSWIGWSTEQRRARLSSVMDAYTCGAIAPYNMLLGGKVVVSMMGSKEVNDVFDRKYRYRPSEFSGAEKHPRLVLITVTSALGRSSLYNRVKLPGLVSLENLGRRTGGWGYFRINNRLFDAMRQLLELDGHPYAFGNSWQAGRRGPNWRMRVIREAAKRSDVDVDVLNHGIHREVFAMPLAKRWKEYLNGQGTRCAISLPAVSTMGRAAVNRWLIPRSTRRPEWCRWSDRDRAAMFDHIIADQAGLLL